MTLVVETAACLTLPHVRRVHRKLCTGLSRVHVGLCFAPCVVCCALWSASWGYVPLLAELRPRPVQVKVPASASAWGRGGTTQTQRDE